VGHAALEGEELDEARCGRLREGGVGVEGGHAAVVDRVGGAARDGRGGSLVEAHRDPPLDAPVHLLHERVEVGEQGLVPEPLVGELRPQGVELGLQRVLASGADELRHRRRRHAIGGISLMLVDDIVRRSAEVGYSIG